MERGKRRSNLNKDAVARVVAAKLFGRAAFALFEGAVEVRHVVEAALVGNFRHALGCVDEHAPAERRFGHVGHFSYFGQRNGPAVVRIHILKYLLNAPAVVVELLVAGRGVGEHAHVARDGQIVQ
nr:hypothetical protein [Tanacetum cinerariifolium]